MIKNLRSTRHNRLAGILRLLLGLIFVMAGALKVAVPHLGEAFEGQLAAANMPLRRLSFIMVPVAEMMVGVALLLGWHARLAAAGAAVIMLVATYVHLVVVDPALFPLQPVEPIGPLILLGGLLYTLWRGGGSWSMDLSKIQQDSGSVN